MRQAHAERGVTARLRWGLSAVVLAAALAACSKPQPLPVMAQLPGFRLTSQSGEPFDSRALDGHIWVADFFFTSCAGPCPMMTTQMRQLQDLTEKETPDVRLVSFTVDPATDTPAVLADYARHYRTNPARWCFLTGEMSRLNDLGLAFQLNTVDGSMVHSTRFVLVDRRRRIRGYYRSSDEGFLKQLVRDIRRLEGERS